MERLADGYAYGRILLGVTALVAPGPVGRGFGIGGENRLAGRYIGGRDLVAGVGMVLARRRGRARGWYEAAALVDLLDAAITTAAGARGAMPRGRAALVTVLALSSAATGMLIARAESEATTGSPDTSPATA